MSICKCKTFDFYKMINDQNKKYIRKNQLANSCKNQINDKLIKEHLKMHKVPKGSSGGSTRTYSKLPGKDFKNHEKILVKKVDEILKKVHSFEGKKRIYSINGL